MDTAITIAWGYCRVSTAAQADHGVNLEAQEGKITAWCQANGYNLGGIFVDRGLSGGRADNRPALQDALEAIRKGDVLVVYSLSRLARSTKDTLAISEKLEIRGADLVSLSERIDTTSATGKMVFRLLAVLAEFERDMVSEGTTMALRHMRACGKFTGGQPPFGTRLGDSGELEAMPEEQAIVRRAHELNEIGLSLRKVSVLTLFQSVLLNFTEVSAAAKQPA